MMRELMDQKTLNDLIDKAREHYYNCEYPDPSFDIAVYGFLKILEEEGFEITKQRGFGLVPLYRPETMKMLANGMDTLMDDLGVPREND
jgi:hypothetical protein